MHAFKKGEKEDPEKYRPISLTSFPRKVMGQILLEAISKHVKIRDCVQSNLDLPRSGYV